MNSPPSCSRAIATHRDAVHTSATAALVATADILPRRRARPATGDPAAVHMCVYGCISGVMSSPQSPSEHLSAVDTGRRMGAGYSAHLASVYHPPPGPRRLVVSPFFRTLAISLCQHQGLLPHHLEMGSGATGSRAPQRSRHRRRAFSEAHEPDGVWPTPTLTLRRSEEVFYATQCFHIDYSRKRASSGGRLEGRGS